VEGKLKQEAEKKKDELADALISELQPSAKGRESLKGFMKQTGYDLTKLRWHGFSWKGRSVAGFWNASTGRYITWFQTSAKPTEIKEQEPCEAIKPEEAKEGE